MTAKQKAIQLLNKYNDFPLTDWWKKQSALIAVDEILNYTNAHGIISLTEYYIEVKQEIEKL